MVSASKMGGTKPPGQRTRSSALNARAVKALRELSDSEMAAALKIGLESTPQLIDRFQPLTLPLALLALGCTLGFGRLVHASDPCSGASHRRRVLLSKGVHLIFARVVQARSGKGMTGGQSQIDQDAQVLEGVGWFYPANVSLGKVHMIGTERVN